MASTDEFFDRRLEWSRYKHLLLEKYLRVWVYKLQSRYQQLAFVDACAGEGMYGDGAPGSPLLAAQWNDEQVLRRSGARLVVHACEAVDEARSHLVQALAPYAGRTPPLARVYPGSFVENLPGIMEATRREPTFVFIDPFGMTDLTPSALAPILEDRFRAPTEVLVRVDPILLARFAGWLRHKPGSERSAKTAASFRRLLASLNVDLGQLEALTAIGDRTRPMPRDVILGDYLAIFEARFKFVQLVPIRPDYWAAPKYYLVHGTDNPHGAAKLNDAVSTTEDTLFDDSLKRRAGSQGMLFDEPRPLRVQARDAEAYIRDLLQEFGALQAVDIRAQLALRFGPDLREKHHNAVFRKLVAEAVLMQHPPGTVTDTTTFTLPN